MKIESNKLIEDLILDTTQNLNEAKKLIKLPNELLNYRLREDSWSILECFEHMNLYGDFYIPEIKIGLDNSTKVSTRFFKSGMLGNYFAKSMLPKEKLNKMKTFNDKNPLGSNLDVSTINRFISQQEQILNLLENSKEKSLNKIKVPISIAKWIKLKLGDVFRIVIYHNIRHVLQANNVLKEQTTLVVLTLNFYK